MTLIQSERTVSEKTTARYTATITNEVGTAIAAADLTTLTLTLYDQRTKTVINSRNVQNVLNDNQVTVDGSGNLIWTMQPADNALVGTPRPGVTEKHIALFRWTWATGAKAGSHEVLIEVKQLDKVS